MSFVFYDTETTGTLTAFDQILQFGAIKTDYELNELARFEIRCRLLPYVVPAPSAMRVTGVTVDKLTAPALPSHYEMVRAIQAKLEEWSPAVFIGHNSLRFDEHLLRQALYKTLHAPYLTNTNGNCRTDSLRMIQAVNLFKPGTLSIPADSKDKPIFKLDRLASANGFDHYTAHDAMGDVEATIHMCRLLMERADDHWSNFVRFAQKATVLDFVEEEKVFSLTEFYYGKAFSWLVTSIGPNPENSSELFVFDLSNDPSEFAALDDDELATRLGTHPKPVRSLRSNACPCILAYEDAPEFQRARGPDIDKLREHAAKLKADETLGRRLIDTLVGTRPTREPSVHVEEQIYDGFADNSDQALMTRFHEMEWSDRAGVIAGFSDPRFKTLGERLIYTEAPETMPAQSRSAYDLALARRLMGVAGTVPWLTLPKSLADTDDLLAVVSGTEAALLNDLRDYLAHRVERAVALLA